MLRRSRPKGDRRRWFEKADQPILALWWILARHTPTVAEAKERLEHLRRYGSTLYAFSFSKPFPSPEAVIPSSNALISLHGGIRY